MQVNKTNFFSSVFLMQPGPIVYPPIAIGWETLAMFMLPSVNYLVVSSGEHLINDVQNGLGFSAIL